MPNDPFAKTNPIPFSIGPDESDGDLDPRLIELSRSYLSALRAGERPSRSAYLDRYPDLHEQARDYLEGIEMAHSLERAPTNAHLRANDRIDIKFSEPIGDFRIIREIGRGGMGSVYEATQISLGRRVALKVLPFAAALDERHRKRFLLEAQAAAQLHHQNIVPVYAVGCERGTHYYAMQLIDGVPVSASMFASPDPSITHPDESTKISKVDNTYRLSGSTSHGHRGVRQNRPRQTRSHLIATLIADVADALEYAHTCGIVHRDVKPGNLLLDQKGKIWITDFGLAHITNGEHVTQTGEMLGTMRYMSPEQASGSRGVVDHRSDVYSLGATLYELLTGQPVFVGNDRQSILNQVLHDDPKPLRSVDRTIPEELETITLKALRHSPSDRYESAKHFADDLRRYVNEMPIEARRPNTIDKARKWMRRHPTVVLSMLFCMAAAMISLAVTTAVIARQKMLTQQSLQQAERRLATAQAAADEMISLAENEFAKTPMEETLRLRLLSSALVYYQALIDDPDLEERVRAELTFTRNKVSKIHDDILLLRDDRHLVFLNDPAVLADLHLSTVQLNQLSDIETLASPSRDSEYKVKEAQSRKLQINHILTPEQRIRLKQIATQLSGPSAILESIISGDLRLTESQMMAIQSAIMSHIIAQGQSIQQSESEWTNLANADTPFNSATFRPDAMLDKKTKRDIVEVILKLMTPEQRRDWSAITGPKFDSE